MNYNTKQKARERVAIAKDALKWIHEGALKPKHYTYVSAENNPNNAPCHVNLDKIQLRDFNLGKCNVCAKGALFLAKAVRYNNVLASQLDLASEDDDEAPLREHFSKNQLRVIEGAFEGFQEDYGYGEYRGCREFYEQFDNARDRLNAILQNIIDNDGTFVLNQKAD